MLTHSTDINEIAAALAKAQADMGNAAKDRTNPAFRSRYADLASVRDAIAGPLAAQGIACVQAPHVGEHGASVETRLIHTSGQWLACVVSAVPADYKPQSIGSAITYLRRYGLMALTGIAPDDDDGNASSGRDIAPTAPRTVARPPLPTEHHASWAAAQPAFFARLADIIPGADYDRLKAMCAKMDRPKPSAMTDEQRTGLLAYLATDKGRTAYEAA